MAPIEDDQKRRKDEILARIRKKIVAKEEKQKERKEKLQLKELPARYMEIDGKYWCKRCKCVCGSKSAIVRHMGIKHDCANERIECGNCGKTFSRHDNYLKHKKLFHRPPSPDAGYHKAFEKPRDELINHKPKETPKFNRTHSELLNFRNIEEYISHMTSRCPKHVRRWEFDSAERSTTPISSKDVKLPAPIPPRTIRYSNFLAPLCRKRKNQTTYEEVQKKAKIAPPTPSVSQDSISITLNTLKEDTRKLLEELSVSSSSDEEPEPVDKLAETTTSSSSEEDEKNIPLSIPAAWETPDRLDLSSEGSGSNIEEQAAALEKLLLEDEVIQPKLVDYDSSDDSGDADDEADNDDNDDAYFDDDLYLICGEA